MTVLQLEASAALLRIMVATGRAKKAELDEVEAQLAAMRAPVPVSQPKPLPMVATLMPEKPKVVEFEALPVGNVEAVFRRKGELMGEIKRLSSEQNELSNTLHTVPDEQDCPGLTKRIIEMRRKIEGLWTEYRFIDRNGIVPKREAEKDASDDPEREIKLLRIATSLRSLRDKRLKLEKKLDKPHLNTKNPDIKVPEWQTELIQVLEEITELELQKEALA
jgi:hypothetical protein